MRPLIRAIFEHTDIRILVQGVSAGHWGVSLHGLPFALGALEFPIGGVDQQNMHACKEIGFHSCVTCSLELYRIDVFVCLCG